MNRIRTGPNSAYRRLVEFFEFNPDECLTVDDITVKFGITKTQHIPFFAC